jgi:hypothetical protein
VKLEEKIQGNFLLGSFYSGKLSKVLFKRKNASAALPGSVTSADFDLSPGTISRWWSADRHRQFKIKNLSYIHSLNKTKQPFYNLIQCFRVKVVLCKNSKKKSENLTLDNTKYLHYTAKKIIKIS